MTVALLCMVLVMASMARIALAEESSVAEIGQEFIPEADLLDLFDRSIAVLDELEDACSLWDAA